MRKIFFILFVFTHSFIQTEETIGIFTYTVTGVGEWDPDSVQSGISGSEEAVIYMSQQLANLGYRVTVFGNPEENSKYSQPDANPRFLHLKSDQGCFDIAIAWRAVNLGVSLKKRAKRVYLWPHDVLYITPTEEQINAFDDVLWLSSCQREQWISKHPGFSKFENIFGNGIEPEQFETVKRRVNPHSCIYGSNYARGLDLLLDLWPTVKENFPDATLDIYYGWQSWGLLTKEKEEKMRSQIASFKALGVNEHGMVGHAELNRAYANSSIWAYPCTAYETFCITALRAQASGALPAIIEGSALTETVKGGFKCDQEKAYCQTLFKALKYAENITLHERERLRDFVFSEYTWAHIAKKWKQLFDSKRTSAIPSTIHKQLQDLVFDVRESSRDSTIVTREEY